MNHSRNERSNWLQFSYLFWAISAARPVKHLTTAQLAKSGLPPPTHLEQTQATQHPRRFPASSTPPCRRELLREHPAVKGLRGILMPSQQHLQTKQFACTKAEAISLPCTGRRCTNKSRTRAPLGHHPRERASWL